MAAMGNTENTEVCKIWGRKARRVARVFSGNISERTKETGEQKKMKKWLTVGAVLVCALIGGVAFYSRYHSDRTAPEIFFEGTLKYTDGMTEEELLSDVSAVDEHDGDVSGQPDRRVRNCQSGRADSRCPLCGQRQPQQCGKKEPDAYGRRWKCRHIRCSCSKRWRKKCGT